MAKAICMAKKISKMSKLAETVVTGKPVMANEESGKL